MNRNQTNSAVAVKLSRLPRGVWALGFVSLFMDTSSEMIHGLRQALDTAGAFIGPLLAMGLMVWFADAVRTVFWLATIPAVIAVAILVFAVHEPEASRPKAVRSNPFAGFRWRSFPCPFWRLIVLVMLFTLTRFSEAFLVLRVQTAGMPLAYAPLALVVMNFAYVLSAYPAGALSDRMPRHRLLAVGCVVMVVADLFLALGNSPVYILVGIAAWGLHMGLTEGLLAALTADYAPVELRGTAFGMINLVRGIMLLVASVLAGGLWTLYGPQITFLTGAGIAVIAAVVAARGEKGGLPRGCRGDMQTSRKKPRMSKKVPGGFGHDG